MFAVGDAYEQTGVPTLFYNPSAWTQLGSVLLFDWPPPVGFSYCGGAVAGDGNSCGAWNDTRAAEVDFAALRAWFDAKFPEYKANDLYLTGESYAGVYVPKLAQQILAHKDPHVYPQLRGFVVGDGTPRYCRDTAEISNASSRRFISAQGAWAPRPPSVVRPTASGGT